MMQTASQTRTFTVGTSTCGVSAGADKVLARLAELATDGALSMAVGETGCIGMCYREPLLEVREGDHATLYSEVTPELAEKIARGAVDDEVADHVLRAPGAPDRDGFLTLQRRIVLANCGHVDPGKVADYVARDGWSAYRKALASMTPDEVIDVVERSGLRGRGGGGFPTGFKWKLCRRSPGDQKYVICNADEGDPGAFMDRSVLEGDPHAVLEGMAIAGFGIGATEGYIYIRAEYPKAIRRLQVAIAQAEEAGHLGANVYGSGVDFHIHIKQGAGAFVCGEETALMASIEGRRGMPRFRPPFPAEKGLFGKPSNINNVETYANVPWILREGAEAYAAYGTERSKGTKVFALAGKVARGGLVEVPMGMTINQLVLEVGGGIREGGRFKAVQCGGPSGGCIPASLGETPIDYDELIKTGAIVGSGGLVVMDDSTCMVDVARFFLAFTQSESCGKCTFCRVGTKRMLEILEAICAGDGKPEHVDRLLELGQQIKSASLCGLGQTAPNPVLTTLKYFREEYEAHITDKRCPAHVCSSLVLYTITDACTGCAACVKACPTNAITGERKALHVLDQEACIRCGKCYSTCQFDAILKD